MINAQITEYLYWAIALVGTALLLGLSIFLARWYFTGHPPRSSSQLQSSQKSAQNIGTGLAWLQVFKD